MILEANVTSVAAYNSIGIWKPAVLMSLKRNDGVECSMACCSV
jgi:hypothetical protein